MFLDAQPKIPNLSKTIIQELAKKYMNGYIPDYYGITFDGSQIVGKNKLKIKPSQARKFMIEVDNYFHFSILENTICEIFDKDDDLYVYYTRHLSGDGFDFKTD